jgi:YbbR domain-containing protein
VNEGAVRRAVRIALTENVGLKAISFVASVLLFVAIRGGEDAEKAVDVDVVTMVPPAQSERVLVADVPDRVEVVVHGPRSLLSSLRDDDVPPVQVDLRSTHARSFDFEESLFQLPAGVRIRSIIPASFPIAWEPRRERRLRVVASLRGDLLPGQSLKGEPAVEPPDVVLVGAESALDEVETAFTETVDLQGLGNGRYVKRVRLRRPPPHAWWADDGPLSVTFEVGPDLVERTFHQLPVRVANGSWQTEIHPRTIDVTLRGPREAIAGINADRLLPFIDGPTLEAQGPGTYREPPKLEDLPPGVEMVASEPGHVFVDVRRPR